MKQEIDHYFIEIEAAFNHRRGKFKILSPLDWQLMESWQQRGIPLSVVLAAINEIFDTNTQQRQINSLSYCKQAVERRFTTWSENQIGAHDAAERLAPASSGETAADPFEAWLKINNLFNEYLTADIQRMNEITNSFEIANQ